MEITILLPQNLPKENIGNLKNYLERASITSLENVEIDKSIGQPGQMGAGDVLNSITAIIHAAEKPLVELVKCLQKYVDNYRTVITIPTKAGEMKITQGRSMSAAELKDLITAIQDNK